MFKVKHKENDEIYNVYSVRVNKEELTMFLIYEEEEWRWVFANQYKAI
jgi:hypothetical protein